MKVQDILLLLDEDELWIVEAKIERKFGSAGIVCISSTVFFTPCLSQGKQRGGERQGVRQALLMKS